jgi:hypothetical protein
MLEKKFGGLQLHFFRRGHGIVNTTEFLNQILTHRILALGKKKVGEIFKVTSVFDWIAFEV